MMDSFLGGMVFGQCQAKAHSKCPRGTKPPQWIHHTVGRTQQKLGISNAHEGHFTANTFESFHVPILDCNPSLFFPHPMGGNSYDSNDAVVVEREWWTY
jgi:hypothetical protein